jgi:hypothetical protein
MSVTSEQSDLSQLGDFKEENSESTPDIPWTPEHENILVDWADKAMCFRWLHAQANQQYSKANAWFTIPVIIMSTVTGTANFAQDKFGEVVKPYVSMIIGSVNIAAGIITTIQQFLKVSELNEAHRVASIAWDKFYRNVKVELAKSPRERMPVSQMIKIQKEEFDRLMETSPVIEDDIIQKFRTTFKVPENLPYEQLTDKQKLFKELKKPEICDVLESTKRSVYKPKVETNIGKNAVAMAEVASKRKEQAKQEKTISEFITRFKNEYSRDPTQREITQNLQDDMPIGIITSMLKKRGDVVLDVKELTGDTQNQVLGRRKGNSGIA